MTDSQTEQLHRCAEQIQKRTQIKPEFGLVLGSGLGFLADKLEDAHRFPYSSLPGFPLSTVPGHAGQLCLGSLSSKNVAVMQGRFHFYEGYPMSKVTMGIRLMAHLGCNVFFITNAAGGIRADLRPGDLMLIRDHINFMGTNPLIGENDPNMGPRFPDMSAAYDATLRSQAGSIAAQSGILIKEGVYAAFSGPSYETPAEIRMLGILGADAVGMSTVPEVISARHLGCKVLGISCISNLAAGRSTQPLSHTEVTQTTNRVRDVFSRLVLSLVGQVSSQDES